MAKKSPSQNQAKIAAPAAELANEIASTLDGRDITKPFVADLEQPRDPRLLSSVDWGVYERIRKDDQVKSCMEQRIRAVVSAEWDVLPGDNADARSIEAADRFKENIQRVSWDRVTKKMLYAILHGYSVAEVLYPTTAVDGLWQFSGFKVRNARRFRYDKDRNLRLLTKKQPQGEALPDKKFWVVTEGGTDDDEIYGEGLADWLYWPVFFKRNGMRFWNIFLDKFGSPTAKVTYKRGATKKDVATAIELLRSLSQDSGIAVPEGIAVEFLEVARSGVGDYHQLCVYMDSAISKIILSQTMTTDNGSSNSQAQVHAGVKLEVVKADADLLSDSFNEGPARWWTDWNYGPDVASPQLVRLVDEEADLKVMAETDAALSNLGWVRSDESFRDTYGDGYERKPEQPVASSVLIPSSTKEDAKVNTDNLANDNPAAKAIALAASDPKPLYVYRRLKNAKDVIAWAKSQGFTSTLAARDLHVTITYSRTPVNWFAIHGIWSNGEAVIQPGGARAVDKIGDDGAVALHFTCDEFTWRNREMRDDGCSWDYPEYQPHLTITYDGAPADLSTVEPYLGKLVFGPEIYEHIDTGWDDGLNEITLAADDVVPPIMAPDPVDQMVADLLASDGWKPLSNQLSAIVAAISQSNSPDELDQALLTALAADDRHRLVQALARSQFTLRIAAEVGDNAS
jgi:phage gp29-like protein